MGCPFATMQLDPYTIKFLYVEEMSTLIRASAGNPFFAALSRAFATAPLILFVSFPKEINSILLMQSLPETYCPFWTVLGTAVAPVETMEKRAIFCEQLQRRMNDNAKMVGYNFIIALSFFCQM